jgi:hypothetical protein
LPRSLDVLSLKFKDYITRNALLLFLLPSLPLLCFIVCSPLVDFARFSHGNKHQHHRERSEMKEGKVFLSLSLRFMLDIASQPVVVAFMCVCTTSTSHPRL